MKRDRTGSRLYRLVLRALPGEFRHRHGTMMEATFCSVRAEARRRGILAVVALHMVEAWDVVRTGLALRARARRRAGTEALAPGWRRSGVLVRQILADEPRMAVRAVARNRGFFLLAALTFALGVGATTATFSALKSVILEPLPYPGAERLVIPWRTTGGVMLSPGPRLVEALQADRSVFEAVTTFGWFDAVMTGSGEAAPVESVTMGPGLADFLGIRPYLGRSFGEEEFAGDGSRVLLLSHALWRGEFGGSRDVLGRTITLNGEPWTVIGVMPPGLVRPNGMPGPVDLWLPLAESAPYREAIARMRPGVTLEEASAAVDALFRRVTESDEYGGVVRPATAMREAGLRDPLEVLMIAVTLLLGIACLNVSSLLVNRASARRRQTAMLAALGASRWRILRQFLAESLLLALLGGAIGVALAAAATRAINILRPASLQVLETVRLDGGVLAFSLALCTTAGLAFGLLPAVRAARVGAGSMLARGSRDSEDGGARVRWALVGVQVAFSFALLVGASLVVRTLHEYSNRDPGYVPEGLLDVHVALPSWRYPEEPERRLVFERIAETARHIPGVERVSLAGGIPPRAGIYFGQPQVEGEPPRGESARLHGTVIDARYLGVIGQSMLAGRTFSEAEMAGQETAAILGETAARQLFPEGGALGRRFRFGGGDMNTVVGIVRDAALTGLSRGTAIPIAYWPMTTMSTDVHLVVRTTGDPPELANALRRAALEVEPEAIIEVARATDLLGVSLSRERFTTSLLTTFAALALLLCAVGLYSVLSQIVRRRTHEIGVRVSLGASAGSIRRLVLRTGVVVIACGLAGGGVLVAFGLRLIGTRVFGLSAQHPLAWTAAALVLGTVSLLALWQPAARAVRVDPMRAMRAE